MRPRLDALYLVLTFLGSLSLAMIFADAPITRTIVFLCMAILLVAYGIAVNQLLYWWTQRRAQRWPEGTEARLLSNPKYEHIWYILYRYMLLLFSVLMGLLASFFLWLFGLETNVWHLIAVVTVGLGASLYGAWRLVITADDPQP